MKVFPQFFLLDMSVVSIEMCSEQKKFQMMSHYFKKRKNMKNCKIKKVVKMIFFKNSITLVMFKNLFKSFRRGKTSQMCPKCHFHISAVLCRSISYVQHLSTTC